MQKNGVFECGFTSFLGQNRTQFSISFFIFALLFLLFDLEILLVYPYLVSAYINEIYGLTILLLFLLALTLGFVFELGKKALTIDSRQTNHNEKKGVSNDERKTNSDVSHAYNLVIMKSSFMNYKVFNRDFWRAYLVTLKTKFTVKHIVFSLLTITLVYCFRNYLQFLLDVDLAKFFHYALIMIVSSTLFKAILHLLEFMYDASEMAKIPMGTDNPVDVITPKKVSKTGNIFAMNGVNENSGSNRTNNVELSNAVANNTVPNASNNAQSDIALKGDDIRKFGSQRARDFVREYLQRREIRDPYAPPIDAFQNKMLHKAATEALQKLDEIDLRPKSRLEQLIEKRRTLSEMLYSFDKRSMDADIRQSQLIEKQATTDSRFALTQQQREDRAARQLNIERFYDYKLSLRMSGNLVIIAQDEIQNRIERER